MKPLTKLSKKIHKDNVEKGFYGIVRDIVNKIDMGHGDMHILTFAENAFIVQQLALVITEVSEAIEKFRKDGIDLDIEPPMLDNELTYDEQNKIFEINYKDTVQDELADTFIRLLDLVGYLEIDIDRWIDAKLRYNKSRPYMHGKKF